MCLDYVRDKSTYHTLVAFCLDFDWVYVLGNHKSNIPRIGIKEPTDTNIFYELGPNG